MWALFPQGPLIHHPSTHVDPDASTRNPLISPLARSGKARCRRRVKMPHLTMTKGGMGGGWGAWALGVGAGPNPVR